MISIISRNLGVCFCFLFIITSLAIKAQPSPPFSVHWINPLRVYVNGSILTKGNYPTTWIAGAISSNVLEANINGWIEFASTTGAHYIIGLAYDNVQDWDKFSYAIMVDQVNNSYAAYEGSTIIGLGTCHVGDVFKIERLGSTVTYYRNGGVDRTIDVNPATSLQIKTCIRYTGKSTPFINASFDSRLILQSAVNGIQDDTEVGSILLNVSGGSAPYTYAWSSEENVNSISSKPFGSYSVTVNDDAGRTRSRVYGLGYDVHWINPIGVYLQADNILQKAESISVWTNAGAVSSNVLESNTNGWIEFEGSYNANYMVGFAVNDLIDHDKFTNGIMIDYEKNLYRIYEGATLAKFGPWQTGDLFRISRDEDEVIYYRNNTEELRRVSVNPALVLKAKTSIKYKGLVTPNLNLSFENSMVLQGTVTGLTGNSGSGSISFAASGGKPPYSYSWSSGEQTGSLIDKQHNAYEVTVTDAAGRTESRTYNVGYKVNWTNQIGVTTSDGILTKHVIGAVWYNAGAVSTNILPANTDGWMEFSASGGDDYLVGLAVNNTIDSDEFSNAVRVDALTNTYALYSGPSVVSSGIWQTGDVFRVSRVAGKVHYYKNDGILKSVDVNPALVLKVKASIRHRYYSTPVINTSFWNSDGILRTYYSISDGNWTTPSIWSLSENGPPSTVYPDDIDKVVIKGHEVTINSMIKSAGVTLNAINDNTKLKIDGGMGILTVKGNILMKRANGTNSTEVLLVENNARLDVK